MKKSLTTLLTLLIIPLASFAQDNFSEEYGKVTQYEISMTEYDQDPEAEALVIYDLGTNYFYGHDSRGFLLRMEVRNKTKVLKQAGISYANIEIPYYVEGNNFEQILDLQATVHNLDNGKYTKSTLDQSKVFEEKADGNWRIKKIALPDVREGSVIEYKYTIETPFYFQMRKWYFQQKIPVLHSQLVYKAIPYYEYTYITRGGITKFDEFSSVVNNREIYYGSLKYKEQAYTFGMKNLPAFRDEEYISSIDDYLVSLNFQISRIYYPTGGKREYLSTWPAMCDDFLKRPEFGKYIKDSEKEGKKLLPTLNIDNTDQLSAAKDITQYVRTMYKWNKNASKFTTDKLSSFLKLKTGNSADINLFLVGLLRAAGIEAHPLVLSTRAHGAISKGHPFQQFLNYTIVKVDIDNKKYYIEATEPYRFFDELPTRCINVEALVVKPKSEEWVVTTQKEVASTEKIFKIKVQPEKDLLDVKIQYNLTGQDAYEFRTIYDNENENLAEHFRKRNNITKIDSLVVENYDSSDKPFSFSFISNTSFENASGKLFIHPFCNMSISENMFKQNSRTLPIDLVYLQEVKYKSEIEIPEGYTVEYLPKTLTHSSSIMSINYTAQVIGNKIEVSANYSFNTNLYDAKAYLRLKHSFSEIIKHFSDMVVLVKK